MIFAGSGFARAAPPDLHLMNSLQQVESSEHCKPSENFYFEMACSIIFDIYQEWHNDTISFQPIRAGSRFGSVPIIP